VDNEITRILSVKENGLDDGWEEYLETVVSFRLSEIWRLEFQNQTEYLTYDTQDIITFDYIYSTTEFETKASITGDLDIFVRPSFAIFWSRWAEFDQQDYTEAGFEYGFDLARLTSMWLTISHKIAHRNYTSPSRSFYSDYLLNQVDLLGDMSIMKNLRIDAIISIDWESHEVDENDNSLLLMSVGLEYAL
jgi:hypothetical protein